MNAILETTHAQVGCAGILIADTFCGPMKELPREGQLLAVDAMPTKAGGCAANVALDLVKQGVAVEVLGCVGRDVSAEALRRFLEQGDVGCRHLICADGLPTSRTVILLVEGQDRRYLHSFGANGALTVGHIRRDWVANLEVFYLGGLGAMPGLKTVELLELLTFCRSQGVTTVVDVVIPQQFAAFDELRSVLPHVDYFLPNDDEARRITGATDPLAQLRTLHAAGAHTVIITQGKTGAVASRGKEFWRCGAFPTRLLDPSGAGDAFASGIITGVLGNWDLPQALRYASALGASATRAVGTTDGVFTAEEAVSFLNSHPLEVSNGKL
jgi:sugar/nucleoside kinase (ribokinase family)